MSKFGHGLAHISKMKKATIYNETIKYINLILTKNTCIENYLIIKKNLFTILIQLKLYRRSKIINNQTVFELYY